MNIRIPEARVKATRKKTQIEPKCMSQETLKNLDFNKNFRIAFSLQSKNYYDKAIRVYEKLSLTFPNNLQAKVNLSYCLIKLGMNERALEVLESLAIVFPKSYNVNYNKAVAYFSMGQKLKAINTLEEIENNNEIKELKELITSFDPDFKLPKDIKVNVPIKSPHEVKTLPTSQPVELKPLKFNFKISEVEIPESPSTSHKKSQSNDKSFKESKSLTFDEIVERQDFLSKWLAERENRLSILSNTSRLHEKSNLHEGFHQESVMENPLYTERRPRKTTYFDVESVPEAKFSSPDTSADDIAGNKLSRQTVKFILEEYKKPKEKRDYTALLTKFSKLPFFAKFPKPIQMMLLEISELVTYKTGDIIIKQGDLGECMFVILNGSVTIHRKAAEFRNFNIIVNSLYDGEAFGELSLLNNPKESDIRRTASCVAGENTTLVSISKTNYRHIILDQMHNDIIERIQFIKDFKFFSNQPWLSLIPFASSLEAKTFRVGEVILEQGEIPSGMYIIYQGQCKVYWEGYVSRPKTARKERQKPFLTGNSLSTLSTPKNMTYKVTENFEKIFHTKAKLTRIFYEKIRAASYLQMSNLPFSNAVKERIDYDVVREGEYFAGRAIASKLFVEPSKFTVVSESNLVKIFLVTKRNISYLGEDFYEELKESISRGDDIDCPKSLDKDYLQDTFVKWQSYKADFVGNIAKNRSEGNFTFR
ncbi:hypothetical protein SteCoe_20012 [Stentor coeruleus]|uniref:Cyclic nucleotide-binding domain-containing protein n=1 Tax=Stentor coeruleus TaxID=5963 RepID=A0A1R2BSS3_9CILI|nr:hypothetical protein SteCoe_20012 [Stentor coeruleus]